MFVKVITTENEKEHVKVYDCQNIEYWRAGADEEDPILVLSFDDDAYRRFIGNTNAQIYLTNGDGKTIDKVMWKPSA